MKYAMLAVTVALLSVGTAGYAVQGPASTQPNNSPAAAKVAAAPAAQSAVTATTPPPAVTPAPVATGGMVTQPTQALPAALPTLKAQVGYAIGVNIMQNFAKQGMDIDVNTLTQGIKDAATGGTLLMTQQQMQDTMMAYSKQMAAQREAEFNAQKLKNQQASTAFLTANRAKPGVVVLPDGLQYKVLQAGKGPHPTDTDIVTVHYAGTFIDGKEFDSSYQRGKPVTFPLKELIPGWIEALKLMQPGAIWEIYVPANLAYGERGAPPVVGPNQALVFKINLIEIKGKAA